MCLPCFPPSSIVTQKYGTLIMNGEDWLKFCFAKFWNVVSHLVVVMTLNSK